MLEPGVDAVVDPMAVVAAEGSSFGSAKVDSLEFDIADLFGSGSLANYADAAVGLEKACSLVLSLWFCPAC
jgi:hypothetical protein